jgi:hypothetical protein
MRTALTLMVCIALAACSREPTPEHQKLIAAAEKVTRLPTGAGELRCYERHYVLLEGQDAVKYFGGVHVPGNQLLVGEYVRGGKPGIYWHRNIKEMPDSPDAGCRMLHVAYIPGDAHWPYRAECAPDIGGSIVGQAVNPPVHC